MNVERDKIVTIQYALTRQSDGTSLADSEKLTVYMHGHNTIVTGLEVALKGRELGERFTVDIPALQAYGARRDGFVERVPVKYLSKVGAGRITAGSIVRFTLNDDVIEGTVLKMGKYSAEVDMNHPLAGEDIHFDVHVLNIREASIDELANGYQPLAEDYRH